MAVPACMYMPSTGSAADQHLEKHEILMVPLLGVGHRPGLLAWGPRGTWPTPTHHVPHNPLAAPRGTTGKHHDSPSLPPSVRWLAFVMLGAMKMPLRRCAALPAVFAYIQAPSRHSRLLGTCRPATHTGSVVRPDTPTILLPQHQSRNCSMLARATPRSMQSSVCSRRRSLEACRGA